MKVYGCHNRKPLATSVIVQTGWYADGTTRAPRMEMIDQPMSKDCRYSVDTPDPRCTGCQHNQQQKGDSA